MDSPRIVFAPGAQRQIAQAARYIKDELGLPKAAKNLLDAIEDKASVLTAFPNAYPVDEKASYLSGREIRTISMKAHRLLYRFDAEKNEVHILSLRFGGENPNSLLASDLKD